MRTAVRMLDERAAGAVRVCNRILDHLLMLGVLAALLVSVYAVRDSGAVTNGAAPEQYEVYKPTGEDALSFAELQKINSDVFAWVTVYGTHIDYPVLQGEDNARYVNTSPEGEYSLAGSVFLDYRYPRDLSAFNNLLYGHHMSGGMMFGDIDRYEDETFFEEHRCGALWCSGREYGLDIFAVFHGDAADTNLFAPPAVTPEHKEAYLDVIREHAAHLREIGVMTEDRLLILSTCATGGRTDRNLLAARITDSVPKNIYAEAEAPRRTPELRSGGTQREYRQVSYRAWFLLLLLLIITAADVVFRLLRRELQEGKKRRRAYESEKHRRAEKGERMEKAEQAAKGAGSAERAGPTRLSGRTEAPRRGRKKRNPLLSAVFGVVYELAVIFLLFLLIYALVFGVHRNDDIAMQPGIRDGDLVAFYRLDKEYSAEDVVVLRRDGKLAVRRVCAVAGDTVDIRDGRFVRNGVLQGESYVYEVTEQFTTGPEFPLTVPEGMIFVLGDAREHASDSRVYGCVPIEDSYGTVVMILRRREI